jgi:hypothetical protein
MKCVGGRLGFWIIRSRPNEESLGSVAVSFLLGCQKCVEKQVVAHSVSMQCHCSRGANLLDSKFETVERQDGFGFDVEEDGPLVSTRRVRPCQRRPSDFCSFLNLYVQPLLILAFLCATSMVEAQVTLDVRDFGARCDWNDVSRTGDDDTAAFSAASTAANAIFQKSGAAVNVMVTGGCKIEGSVVWRSGTHFVGPGSVIVPVNRELPPFKALMADDVGMFAIHLVALSNSPECGETENNSSCAAIAWQTIGPGTETNHKHIQLIGNEIDNFGWGILVSASEGSDYVSGVDVERNTIQSSHPYSYADGIHLAGAISDFQILDNRVNNRSDAAIGVTSETGGHQCRDGIIARNILLEDRLGIDDSGCQNLLISANYVNATTPILNKSNPAFRAIVYGGFSPQNVSVTGNTFINFADPTDDHATKFDNFGGANVPLLSVFSNNTTTFLYIRGSTLSVSGNTILPGGGIFLDYDAVNSVLTENLLIGTNYWLGDGTITVGANPSFFKNSYLAPQMSTRPLRYVNESNIILFGAQ